MYKHIVYVIKIIGADDNYSDNHFNTHTFILAADNSQTNNYTKNRLLKHAYLFVHSIILFLPTLSTLIYCNNILYRYYCAVN